MRLQSVDRLVVARTPARTRSVASNRPAAKVPAGYLPLRPVRRRSGRLGREVACVGLGGADRSVPLLRLSRRGMTAVVLILVVGGFLIGTAAQTATRVHPAEPGLSSVVVHDGDTLWGLAAKFAPERDPRDEVADLIQWNGLSSPDLTPGQILRTR